MKQNEAMVKMVLDRWFALVKDFDTTLNVLTDDDLNREIVSGKNRGIYLLGHMVAVHDDMLPLLDFGQKMYPQLQQPFLKSPDKAVAQLPTAKELRALWAEQVNYMTPKIKSLQAADWFEKHTAVSADDFAKEPHRNKLNIMLTRSTHLAYHQGQFILLEHKNTND